MSVFELLSSLNELGVRVWAEGEGLRYSAPKGALTAELRARVQQQKPEIIEFLRKAEITAASSLPPIERISRDGPLPLSFAQQRLWFLSQLKIDSAAYNAALAWRLTGRLNVAALTQAFSEIVRRHETLRTIFATVDGQAVQQIAPPGDFDLRLIDLQGLPEDERRAESQRLIGEDTEAPFDLATAPRMRAMLLRLEPEVHVLVIAIDHISCDGWSMGIFFRELSMLYGAFAAGARSPLPELPVQYPDFASWQRQWLQGEVLENQLSYWKKQLAGAPEVLDLPTTRLRPPAQTFNGSIELFHLSPEVHEKLKLLSQQSGATMFVVLLTAFNILLSRYSGQQDLVVGAPIANRRRQELEPLIGFFANTLMLRADLTGNPTCRELLNRVRQVTLDAFAHQDVPFEKLVEELRPERDLNRNPLVQVLFVLQNAFDQSVKFEGLELSWESQIKSVRFDLELHIWDDPPGLLGTLMYNTDLFDRSFITRMGEHFQVLLGGILANPDCRISDLPLITEKERQELLLLSENLAIEKSAGEFWPSDRLVHQLFEAQVKRTPGAIALTAGKQSLTYEELNARANQLAHYLKSIGVDAESPIGICIEPGPNIAVALLGILKAGAAYLPLDPSYPQERLAFMLRDEQCRILLSQSRLAPNLSEHAGSLVYLDQEWSTIAGYAGENPADAPVENLAALIYAAGRGVPLDHRAIIRRLSLLQEKFHLTAADVVLQRSAIDQDSFLWESLWPLLVGAQVHFAADEARSEPDSLRRVIGSQKVSMMMLPPALLAAFVEGLNDGSNAQLNSLRAVLCLGEGTPRPVVNGFFEHLSCELHNLRSYTEAGVIASQVEPGTTNEDTWLNGYPLGMSAYVLDQNRQLAPLEINGEIHLAGEGLGRGYWRDADETKRRFITHPFDETGGARLFKTGDVGRRRENGNLEIVSSMRGPVWVDGYRVALEEVEAAILEDPSIDDCVVVARTAETGGRRLLGYVVVNGPLPLARVHANLKARLPPFMLPCALVPISAVPLTTAGQIDEQALAGIEVIDDDLIRRWEDALSALPEIDKAAVVIQPQTEHLPPLHLSDVLPAAKASARVSSPDSFIRSNGHPAESHQALQPAPAFSDGGPLTIAADAPQTLTDALVRTANDHKEKGITFVQSDGSQVVLTYELLLQEAKCILTGLRANGMRAGDRAILQIPSLRDHFSVFWACLLGGITPVTVAIAPSYEEENAVVNKLLNAWKLLGQPLVLTTDALEASLSRLDRFLPVRDLRVLSVSRFRQGQPAEQIHQSDPGDVAFLQLTSGSTGVPKCIQITHQSIIRHVHAGREFNSYSAVDVSLNWLPMDHVVPILTCHLKDTYLACQQVAVSTNVVLANPLAWLDLIEEHRVTQTWSPNFGFKLVSDSLAKAKQRSWDLSSIKFFMNAGEQVTLPVVREFLDAVAAFGVRPQAMQPAFGMAEVCTCMTYQNSFDYQSSVHRVLKSSLGGQLKTAQRGEAEAIEFIDLGRPVPGVEIRIAGPDNQLLSERAIGRLQIRGGVVTPGYLNNEAANTEAFVGDGWFNSGDLGFIQEGRLTLTGREKELIIINGANFYCYEIEDVVNQIAGVEPTYAAACGFDDPNSGTEGLAIFFSPAAAGIDEHVELIKTIRAKVTKSLGISPAQVVPIPKREFPKTTSGKIQRTKLKNLLVAGHFRELLRGIDIHLENANTLPNWFYQKTWRRHQGTAVTATQTHGPYLIFSDDRGLGSLLAEELRRSKQVCICVEAGSEFARLDERRFQIVPDNPNHYSRLFQIFRDDEIEIKQILHLWTFDDVVSGAASDQMSLAEAERLGVYSLLFLAQSLAKVSDGHQTIRLSVISNHVHSVGPNDFIACAKSSIAGLMKTIPQEMPWLSCAHIDVQAPSVEMCAAEVMKELRLRPGEQQVAYRDGVRWVPRLERVDFSLTRAQPLPFKAGGVYLISGGLGDVGVEIAKYLLSRYQARLILIGRSSLPERNSWARHLELADDLSRRIQAYQSLEQLGGELIYRDVDVVNLPELETVVAAAEARWGKKLDGVVHLAGVLEERALQDETLESFSSTLRPKVLGTLALQRLLKENSEATFISFSSVNGFFGGVRAGAYSAANSFLEGFTDWQRKRGRAHCYCFHWSHWDELGLSRNHKLKTLARSRGYQAISAGQGLQSFVAGLHHRQAQMFIGLDSDKPHIRRYVASGPLATQKLTAFFSSNADSLPVARLQREIIQDQFSKSSACDFLQLQQMPLKANGEIDRERLMSDDATGRASRARGTPRTELENQIARIWRNLLGAPGVGIYDSFFELGGHSLLAVRLIFEIREALKVEFPLEKIIEAPTIAGMARWIEDHSRSGAEPAALLPDCLLPLQPQGTKPPFFCVHPSLGSPLCYLNLAAHLGAERPFYGFQSPGLIDDKKPLTRVEEMAALYVEAMRAVQPNGPYLLGGWSSAGPIIFEMARLLESQNERVDVLAFFDCGLMESDIPNRKGGLLNPLLVAEATSTFLKFLWQIGLPRSYAQLRSLWSFVGISLPVSIREFLGRNSAAKLRFLRALHSDMMRSARVFRYNTRAGINYEPGPYAGKATLFRPEQSGVNGTDPMLEDLRKFATGGVEKYIVPGNHISIILGQDESKILVEKLRECLDHVQTPKEGRENEISSSIA